MPGPGNPVTLLPRIEQGIGGRAVPSITRRLDATHTAQWYQGARCSGSWGERQQCFDALAAILAERRAHARPYERASQPPIRVPGILTEVAHRAHFSSREPVYKRWRARQSGRQVPRWAGPDAAIAPASAFIDEAKIVAFWPYRAGVLDVAGAFDMTVAETLAAYMRSLAAWARDHMTLAAYSPPGPPACVIEDMEVFGAGDGIRVARLTELCAVVVMSVLADPSMTPLGAFNMVRDEVTELYPDPEQIGADRVGYSLAELSERLMRGADGLVDADQASRILAAVNELQGMLAASAVTGGPR